jgi:NhaP-type Na+/H+ or K+/H+ antiporter
MDSVSLVAITGLLLMYALSSKRLSTSVVSAAMFFLVGGWVIGPSGLDLLALPATSSTVELLAELTLALVLFSDASRVRLSALRQEASLPIRLLGIGLPLTIVLGTLTAWWLLPELLLAEAVVLAVILAPTDAALGQAVVSDERLPARIRQALNVESGLNDGICVPLLVIALAWADAESAALSVGESVLVAAEAIGYGIAAGIGVGAAVAWALRSAAARGWTGGGWEQVVPLAAALGAYGVADWWGGSGFIAAFVAGIVFGWLFGDHDSVGRLLEEGGALTNAATFVVLGAVLVFPTLDQVDFAIVLYALLSLTAVRMLPVAVAMLGTGARPPTVMFVGWFGPRGLASLVFVVLVLDTEGLAHGHVIVSAALATVLSSVFAHGISAVPLVNRYAAWYSRHPRAQTMEAATVHVPRWRGQLRAEQSHVRP